MLLLRVPSTRSLFSHSFVAQKYSVPSPLVILKNVAPGERSHSKSSVTIDCTLSSLQSQFHKYLYVSNSCKSNNGICRLLCQKASGFIDAGISDVELYTCTVDQPPFIHHKGSRQPPVKNVPPVRLFETRWSVLIISIRHRDWSCGSLHPSEWQ